MTAPTSSKTHRRTWMKFIIGAIVAIVVGYIIVWIIYRAFDTTVTTFEPVYEKKQTIPSNAQLVKEPHGGRVGGEVQWQWEFTSRNSWSEYQEWVRSQLSDYHVIKDSGQTLVFGKSVPGDRFYLVIERMANAPLQIKIDLRAGPD